MISNVNSRNNGFIEIIQTGFCDNEIIDIILKNGRKITVKCSENTQNDIDTGTELICITIEDNTTCRRSYAVFSIDEIASVVVHGVLDYVYSEILTDG